MGLRIANSYHARVATAIMFYSPQTCGGEGKNFQLIGWWNIDPGGSALVYANDLDDVNRYWYYHAHATDGAFWAGQWSYPCPPQAFNRCWGVGVSDGISRGFRQLDIGSNDNFTLTLTA
jgi:uncharacterized membrane protein